MAIYSTGDMVGEVASLSAGQVTRLLRSLELHRQMLQVGHEDARRLALSGLRPGYLLDFELIFRYMFYAEERPDWVQELQYLFDRRETTFLIGPGTQFEISQFMYSAGFLVDADGSPEDLMRLDAGDRSAYGLDESTVKLGIYRLKQLLELPNIRRWAETMSDPQIDQEAFDTAKAALDRRRRGPTAVDANRSDALNWAAVVYLRRHAEADGIPFHPYLLTATKPLLNENTWSTDIVGPVSRRPSEAIYTEVLLEAFTDPSEAANHTVEVAWEAASLERALRHTPAYLNPEEYQDEPEWERAIEENLVTDEFRAQLEALSGFITDPVVTETQRIYDNASLASASITQQRGDALRTLNESPRKLFDLIVEVSAALGANRGGSGLAELWNIALELCVQKHPGRVSYELLDRGPRRRSPQYLVAERYQPTELDRSSTPEGQASQRSQFVLRWPSSLDAEDVMEFFCRAFERHQVKTVELTVGTDAAIERFGAELPITLAELMHAVCEQQSASGEEGALAQLLWVRMGSKDFDLYADVSPPGLTAEPVVGVFVEELDAQHLEDLYVRTSARYVFPAWLRRAIEAIADDAR